MFFGAPLLLGSALGIGLAVLATLLMAIRIGGEERLFLSELEGYAEYRQTVKYRLVSFVWYAARDGSGNWPECLAGESDASTLREGTCTPSIAAQH